MTYFMYFLAVVFTSMVLLAVHLPLLIALNLKTFPYFHVFYDFNRRRARSKIIYLAIIILFVFFCASFYPIISQLWWFVPEGELRMVAIYWSTIAITISCTTLHFREDGFQNEQQKKLLKIIIDKKLLTAQKEKFDEALEKLYIELDDCRHDYDRLIITATITEIEHLKGQ